MLDFKAISKVFSNFLDGKSEISDLKSEDKLACLIELNIETNWRQWHLEDSARMMKLGPKHIANAKQKIDKNNQVRNDLITAMDVEITKQTKAAPLGSQEKFYSESPGMITDWLAILHIKLSVIRDLLALIKEADLIKEYKEKKVGEIKEKYFDS